MRINTHFFLYLLLFLPPYVAAQGTDNSDDENSGHNSTPTIAIVFAILTFFFAGAFALFRHLSGENVATNAALNTARGLNADIISALPIYSYSDVKQYQLGVVELECAVCLCEFQDTDELRLLRPGCCHVFHPNCIDPWLVSHVTCPICRYNLTGNLSAVNEPHAIIGVSTLDHEDENESDGPEGGREALIVGRFPRSHSTGHSLLKSPVSPLANRPQYSCREPLNSTVNPRPGRFCLTPPIIHPRHGLV